MNKETIDLDEIPSFEEVGEIIRSLHGMYIENVQKSMEDGSFERTVEDFTLQTCVGYQLAKSLGMEPSREEALKNCGDCVTKKRNEILAEHEKWKGIIQKLAMLKSNLP